MKRLLFLLLLGCVLIIISFLLLGDVEIWIKANLNSDTSLLTYTLLSFSFLALDTLLPVPSSVLMILNGKILGFLAGTVVSFLASLLSSVFGFYLGRSANPYFDKFFSERDKDFSNVIFRKYGIIAITISKALPILSEAFSFVAGTTSISLKSFLIYSTIGHLIVSITYSYLGSFSNSYNSGVITLTIIAITVLITFLFQLLLKNKS